LTFYSIHNRSFSRRVSRRLGLADAALRTSAKLSYAVPG